MSAYYVNHFGDGMAAGPAPDNAANIFPAVELNNRAMALCHAGNHVAAERLHHQALGIKITAFGADSIQAALSFNALGQEQRHLGNLVDAEANLKEAVRIRNEIGSPFDGAVSRENLAQVYEEKGDLAAAKELRLTKPLEMACANEDCPRQMLTKDDVKKCARCLSIFYCTQDCQRADWKKRHKRFCKAPGQK